MSAIERALGMLDDDGQRSALWHPNRKDNLRIDGHNGEQWCERCERWCELSRTLIHASDCDVAIHLNLPREKGEGRGGVSLKSFITESIGILRSNSGPEGAMAVDQIEQSVTKEFARLLARAEKAEAMLATSKTITIPRDLHELYKEAAEKWATDAAFKTDVRFVSDTGSVDIGVMCSQCGAKLACKHAVDCKAARILDLPMREE